MAKARSPQYPAFGLKDAVEKIAEIYDKDYQNALPRDVVAGHMGYKALHGKALTALSTLGKFGLLEGRGENTRVSDLAVQIIAHQSGTPERAAAIREAAEKPELFSELDQKFPGGKASDHAIRAYLLTQKFIPSAADAVIRSYRDTKSFVEAESPGYTPPKNVAESEPKVQQQSIQSAPHGFVPAPGVQISVSEPFRVSFTGDGIELTGRLTSAEKADEMIAAIKALKVLLKPSAQTETASPSPEANRTDRRLSGPDQP